VAHPQDSQKQGTDKATSSRPQCDWKSHMLLGDTAPCENGLAVSYEGNHTLTEIPARAGR
jgi:hypothetical protein